MLKKWLGVLAAFLMIASCFLPWVTIDSRGILVSGISAEGTSYGKPGFLHLVLSVVFLIFHFIPRVWAKRANLPVAAINLAWAIRNYFLLTLCRAGDCPSRKLGLYLMIAGAIFMMLAALFPDINLNDKSQVKDRTIG